MSIYSGGFSITRYQTLFKRKNISQKELNEKFGAFRSKPIRLTGTIKELQFGWVIPPVYPEAEEITLKDHWDLSLCQVDDGYLLRFRVEKRRVPTQLMQILFKERVIKEIRRRKGAPISRVKKKELKLALKEELLEQCLPTINEYDVLWNDKKGEILLFSTSKSICEVFEDLFRKTFAGPLGFSVIKVMPPFIGLSNQDWNNLKNISEEGVIPQIDKIMPSDLIS